jgi:hypothetical protein
MADYISEDGYSYSEDEINQTANDNGVTVDEVIAQNKLKLNDNKIEGPGKPKPVAKKDAGATVKSTVSKPVKSSSASQSNPFGEDRSQPEFLTNLQKVVAPNKKVNKLRSFEDRNTGDTAPNSDQEWIPSMVEYKKTKTDEIAIPKEFIKGAISHLNNKEGIKFEIERNDLDLKNPNLYYSTSKKGDEFVNQNYGSDKLKKLGINPDDFDGFINKKGYKNDFINKDQSGAFQRNWMEELEDIAPDWMGRSTQSQEEVQFKKERTLNNYLNLYLKDKDKKANLYKQLKEKELNPEKDWQEIKKTNKEQPVIDPNTVSQYNRETFPILSSIEDERIAKDKKIVEHLKTRNKAQDIVEDLWGAGKELVGGMWNTTQDLITTGLDLVGADVAAEKGRDSAIYNQYKEADTRGYGFISGKSAIIDGIKYQTDDAGNIYNTTHGFNIAGLVDKDEYNDIKSTIDKTGEEDWSISPRGAAKSTGQVIGAMIPQIALTQMTMGLGGAIGTRALATRAGFSSIAEYKNMVNLSEAVGGKVLAKMPLPITKDMAGSIVSQSAFGYSNGYEQTLKAARDAGINDKDSEALALTAGNQMALLYAATAPLSPQTKARELIFGSAEKRLLKEALNEYRNNGTKGFITSLTNGVKSVARGGVGFVEEGGKEAIQENIQQKGEQEIVNADVNELAGQKILKDTYTYQDFVNTSGLAFLSGGMIANAKLPNFIQDPDQRLINLVTLGNNPTTLQSNLDDLVKNGSATEQEAEALKKDAFATARQIRKIPKDIDADTALNLVRRLQDVENLEESKKVIAKPFHTKIDEQIEGLNTEITDIYKKGFEKELTKLNKNVGVAKALAATVGKTEFENPITNPDGTVDALVAFDTQEDGQKALDEYNEKMGLPKSKLSNTVGTNLSNGQIIINKELASQTSNTNVAGHELLHKVLISSFKTLTDEDLAKATELKDKFLGILSAEELAAVNDRILAVDENKERLYSDVYLVENPDEYMTQFFETVAAKKLTWSDKLSDMFARIGDLILPFLKDKGFKNLEFQDGKDVYDFIKDYNKNLRRGKLSKRAIALGDQGKTISKSQTFSKTIAQLKTELSDLEENEGDYDPNEYDQEVKKLEGELKRAIAKEATAKPTTKKEVSEEDTVKEIIKNESGSISSNKVQQIYDTKGREGAAEIIKLFKPITNKIVDKRRDAPDFDRELLTDEIETGVGGILDLITKYKPESGTPLAAWINKYLPVRAIATSRRILGKQFSKDASEEKGLMATETADQGFTEIAKEKPKYKNALESKVFSTEVLETATKKIITILRTLKTRIDAPVSLNKTVTPLIFEIRDEVGKQLDIDVKTMLGGKKDGVLRKELLRTKRYVLENMTTTWLMGKDGQGGIPMAIQKQIDGKWINFPDWVGKKIDREKTTTDQAGRTSGAELVRRLPNVANNISDEVFLAQIIGPDGNPIRGRKESLSKAMSEEGAFDIINADLEEQGPIYETLATNQTRLGVEVMENFPAVFKKDSDRGNVKYSKVFNNFNNSQKEYITNNSFKLATELANINYNITPDEEDIFKALRKVYNNGSISDEDLKELSKDIESYYTPILAPKLKKQSIEYVKNFIDASLEQNINKLDRQKINQLKDAGGNAVNSVTQLFNQQEDIRQAQAINSKFIAHLGKIYNDKELSSRLRKIGAYSASQAQIGNDSFTIKDNQLVPQLPRVAIDRKTKKEKSKSASDQIYSSKGSFWAAAKFALKDVGVVLEPGFTVNRKGYIADSAKALYANRNNVEYLKSKKETAIENQNFLYEILDWYYDPINKVPDATKAMLWKSLNSNQQTPLRKAAIAKWIFDETSGPKIAGKLELRYEHLKSVNETRAQLYKIFSGNFSDSERKFQFANVMEDYNVAVIPISMDKVIGASGFQTKGIAGDVSEGARYYNIVTLGNKELYSLINLDPNAEVKTLGEGFVKFSKAYNTQNANNIEAVTKSLNTKDSRVSKGISVFDFDDTVGLTKGSVLYTMPDGSTGKLNAEEFAKEGGNMLDAGAVFDFSEFSKVVDGKPGPMVEKMKKMIGKFGPENFFILTARPANSAVPIHEFLSSIGIDIPLKNITGLGSSLAQSKADWMTAKAAEGYNDFYFADDAIQNVEAVKKALNIPGVDSKVQQALVKFSLTSKQDLKWNIADWGGITNFNVNNKEYSIILTNTGNFGYSVKDEEILDNLIKKYNLEDEEANLLGSYEGGTLNLVFSNYDGETEITGAGNAFEVFGTVINGVLDYVKNNGTEGLIFTAAEPSRKKLYNAMAAVYANKLGWNAFYEDGIYIVSKYPIRETTNSFNSQPKQTQAVLNVVDIKSPINQAKIKFSKTISSEFNKIISKNTGIGPAISYSDIVAKRKGAGKNLFDIYVPASAADFELLLYNFIGKGKEGEAQKEFFTDALLKPYANGNDLMDAARQSIKNNYKDLIDSFPNVAKKLEKLTPDGNFTYDQALRVAMWNGSDVEIPGLSKTDTKALTSLVNNDAELYDFMSGLIVLGRQGNGWTKPGEYWDSSTIISDLHNLTEGDGRKQFLTEFIDNAEQMFGKWENGKLVGPNINKVEAIYGTDVREAIEDVLYRMTTGKNRAQGKDKITNAWFDWVSGSTGTIMFLNTRSAALQLIGAVNFLNLRDNNPIAAAKALANQPQYWKDFSRIWNSDKMKERRGGLKEDVAAAEIANAAATSKNKPKAVVSYLLKIGYTPTQIADSFAIASGGAPFYRNRIKSYLKEGQTEVEAEKNAWNDFTKVSDETQQSGDPRDISKQQASGAGRLLLTFQNTAMQQSRIVKKSFLDLKNSRGDAKTHIAKITYYLAIQNLMFATLQQGLFAVLPGLGDDKEEEKAKKKRLKEKDKKIIEIASGVVDSVVRGTGLLGGVMVTLKNVIKKYREEEPKEYKADYTKVLLEGVNISPPIGSKIRKIYTGLQQTKFEKDLIKERGWGVMQDGRVHLGPMYSVVGKMTEATTNFPMDRLVTKIENASQAMNSQNKAWQRVMVGMGWTPRSVGIGDTPGDIAIEATAKEVRKEEGKIKGEETRIRTKDSIRALPIAERIKIKREAFLKRREEKLKKRERMKKRKMG